MDLVGICAKSKPYTAKRFLRRHYPDQVLGSRAGLPSSQPEWIRLPVQVAILQGKFPRVRYLQLETSLYSISTLEEIVKLTARAASTLL